MGYTEITGKRNDKVSHMRKLASSAEYRRECGDFFADGEKLLREAVMWGITLCDVFFAGEEPKNMPEGTRLFKVSREMIEYISPMKTPQNVLFSAKIPQKSGKTKLAGAVILENMQDPGNVGTMIRSANAFGIGSVLLLGACADPWSPKTIRASMGAVFREHILAVTYDDVRDMKISGAKLYGAALGEKSADLRKCDLRDAAVAIGNEGNGLTQELLSLCDGEIVIPMNSQCESLNAAAAAAVIMWEMTRDRL